MKRLLIALLILALAAPALADQNPNLAIFLNDAPDGTGDNEVCPAVNATFDVYVCFDRFGDGGGMLGAAFMFVRTFAGFKLVQMNLLPGLDFGDVEIDGWAITAGANCEFPDENGVLVGATVQYLYLGTPGTITVVPHPIDGNSAADCNNELDFWCVHSILSETTPEGDGVSGNFGVCADAPDGDCEQLSPVEDATWGGIKALYR